MSKTLEDLNRQAIGLIESNYIKKCIEESNHIFSVREQLTLLLNSDYTLSKKAEILKDYVDNEDIVKLIDEYYLKETKAIIEEIDTIQGYIKGQNGYVIATTQNNVIFCGNNLDIIIDKATKLDMSIQGCTVSVIKTDSSDEIATITLNGNNEAIGYTLANAEDHSIMTDFIGVPNDINIGDIVTIIGSDERFIVVADMVTESKFKSSLEYKDCCVAVVPIINLDDNIEYKKQIEDVYSQRINNIDNPFAKPDIIMEECFNISILNIEKITE